MPELNPRGLSKLPLGLLGFFGIKNGGEYPQVIANFHQPTLDMSGLLQAAYPERHVVSVSAGFVAGFVQGTIVATGLPAVVPAAETWMLWADSFGIFTGAGDAFLGGPAIKSFQTGTGSSWTRMLRDPTTQAASLTTLYTTIVQSPPIWLSPGDQLGINVQTFTNASATLTVTQHIGIVRFPF